MLLVIMIKMVMISAGRSVVKAMGIRAIILYRDVLGLTSPSGMLVIMNHDHDPIAPRNSMNQMAFLYDNNGTTTTTRIKLDAKKGSNLELAVGLHRRGGGEKPRQHQYLPIPCHPIASNHITMSTSPFFNISHIHSCPSAICLPLRE